MNIASYLILKGFQIGWKNVSAITQSEIWKMFGILFVFSFVVSADAWLIMYCCQSKYYEDDEIWGFYSILTDFTLMFWINLFIRFPIQYKKNKQAKLKKKENEEDEEAQIDREEREYMERMEKQKQNKVIVIGDKAVKEDSEKSIALAEEVLSQS